MRNKKDGISHKLKMEEWKEYFEEMLRGLDQRKTDKWQKKERQYQVNDPDDEEIEV